MELVVLKFPSEDEIEVFENDLHQLSNTALDALVSWLQKRDSKASVLLTSTGGKISELLMKAVK